MVQPHLTYTIRPNSPPGVRLVLDGQELNSARSGLQKEFQWPAAAGTLSGAQGFVGDSIPIGQYDGMWGVFRLFQNADERALGEVSVKWSRVRGLGSATPQPLPQTARIEFVKFPGGFDLFNPKFFEALRCPDSAILAR
jgi:type VI protein secretion system component VasK